MITADNITDEQIRELRLIMAEERNYERWADGVGSTMNVTDLALQRAWAAETRSNGVSIRFPTPAAIHSARARCAEILNARAKEQR